MSKFQIFFLIENSSQAVSANDKSLTNHKIYEYSGDFANRTIPAQKNKKVFTKTTSKPEKVFSFVSFSRLQSFELSSSV